MALIAQVGFGKLGSFGPVLLRMGCLLGHLTAPGCPPGHPTTQVPITWS